MRLSTFKLGLIVNPLAGIGGPIGLKGSDNSDRVREAFLSGNVKRAHQRALVTLTSLQQFKESMTVITCPGAMGEQAAQEAGFNPTVIHLPHAEQHNTMTSAADTRQAAQRICESGVDLLLFTGGDGTARDIYEAVKDMPQQVVLGIPAGVKMHSGVYAISPQAAGEVIAQMLQHKLVGVSEQEVRDIDEDAFRCGTVKTQYYGELLVPDEQRFVQQVKQSGREVEPLVLADIAAHLIENIDTDTLYIVGPGSTTEAYMVDLGLKNTLLGVDVVLGDQLVASDIGSEALEQQVQQHNGPVKIILTAIGGQGHIIGRGNQQITPTVLRKVGRDNLVVIATRTKLLALEGRPLLIDSNDPDLDQSWSGFINVITGYNDAILYPVGYRED